ncbi:MBL fold metallo-hydrolase [Saccharothrix yanglingensis]|uniref:MBL fold metallo-hydrolase n=1 Tax=Saccharothrix yanglingensis TaxID=659496 RepID=A0ABU0X046_9PSEU|nr:MBL fold metallo-hydrolase [Saccharothrix yanglingensis]MDQ2585502.1 MBL fold metallo-hydrolase [Saccharothrix yanglingensis]
MEWTEPGVFEVAPGVHRIPLPLPNDGLHTVNVYAVEDGDGLVLIDSGWSLDEGERALVEALGTLGYGVEDVHRFLVTHLHRDHYTMAVNLRRRFGTRVALGAGEQPSMARILARARDGQATSLREWGAPHLAEKWRAVMEATGEGALRDYEEPDEWLGEVEVGLAKRVLRVVPTPGHTRGHVVFVDVESSLLFAGDHVLPHITPSIGFEPARPALPLGDYLDSLRLVRTYPDLRLLPAHGPVTDSAHARVDELIAHHEDRLEATLAAVGTGTGTAFETAAKLGWTRRARRFADLDLFNQVLAIGETAAHLDVLVHRGLLTATAPAPHPRLYTPA